MSRTARRQGRRHHRRVLGHRPGDRAPLRRGGRARSSSATSTTRRGEARRRARRCTYVHVDVTDKERGRRAVRDRQGRPTARSTSRSTTPASARRRTTRSSTPSSRRGAGCRRSTSPASTCAARRRCPTCSSRARLDHQHRVVRRGDGRGDLADLLLRLQGRRAVDDPRARRAVRPRGRAGQRAVPRTGEHPAAAGAVRQGRGARRPPAGARADGPLRRAGGDGQRGALPRLRRVSASSPPRRSSSTAASPAPTSPRSDVGAQVRTDVATTRPVVGLSSYREPATLGRCGRRAPTCCRPPTRAPSRRPAGCPLLLPPTTPYGDAARAVVARLDGLVVSGGADVDPEPLRRGPARDRHRDPARPGRLGAGAARRRRGARACRSSACAGGCR